MKRITYVSYYSRPDDPQERKSVPACSNKMDSIIETMTELNYDVVILSACRSDKTSIILGRQDWLSEKVSLHFFNSFPWTNILSKLACYFSINGGLLVRLLMLKPNDHVVVYHSLGYMTVIGLAHRIRRFQLVLEVEEIYSDVTGDEKKKKRELSFIKKADKYIFSTQLLEKLLNTENKPVAVIYGTYKVEPKRDITMTVENFAAPSKKIIHCVYAGTFDSRKGGAIAAATAAAYLPDSYHIHIVGFGSERDVENLKKIIETTNSKDGCRVSYDGLKQGEDYIRFIQGCDIGLSTQDPSAAFNATSFPSKILSYLANGLRVVSIRIPAIETSDIGDMLYYYDKQTPESIARAIMSVDLIQPYDSRKRIIELKQEFREDLSVLLNA